MEALGGSRGVSKRRDGIQGSNFWFSFPYRPDYTYILKSESQDSQKETEDLGGNVAALQSGVFANEDHRSVMACEEDGSIIEGLNVILIDDSLTILNVIGRSLRKVSSLILISIFSVAF
jgi:hypothetical protein